jgi:hypothetical protein
MEIRLINPDEYKLLDKDAAGLNPDNSLIAVAVKDGKIMARLAAISLVHMEAAWIDPEIRNGIALARMEALLTEKLKEKGVSVALAFAVDEKMEDYISRLGYERLATAWRKEI